MKFTVSPCLLTKRKKVNGLLPVFIRLTKDGLSVYIKMSFNIPESAWNAKKKRIRDVYPHSRDYNQLLDEQVVYWNKSLSTVPNSEAMSIMEMKEFVLTEPVDLGIEHQMSEYQEHLIRDRRVHEIGKAKTLFENLRAYSGNKNRLKEASDIDARICADFQMFLKDMGLKNNTIRRRMGTFSAFMEYLRVKGQISANPVLEVKKVSEEATSKTRLTGDQIKAIIDLVLEHGSKLWHTRNYFLFSYYNGGIRFGDLCRLCWKDIRNGRLIYKMSKTGEEISFKQERVHLSILQHYKAGSSNPTDYIFPLLKGKVFADSFDERRIISSLNVITNNNLRMLAKLAGIPEKISFHVSRHSFADYARSSNIDLHTISKLLKHTKLATTERYLAGFDPIAADSAMRKLFGSDE